MAPQLQPFLARKNPSLQVFCPTPTVIVSSFEPHLPEHESIVKMDVGNPFLPTNPCWLQNGLDYFAFLPRERKFHGHLLASLNYRNPLPIERDGRWYVDDATCNLLRSLDDNITKSIQVISQNLLVDLEHREPAKAIQYGFSKGHKSEQNLRTSLAVSKVAFIHRLAYLASPISLRYQWDRDLISQEWWKELLAWFKPTWVDSIWDWIYRQWETRNFVCVVVRPLSSSVMWLRPALNFGVPIWVQFPRPDSYEQLNGGLVMRTWLP